MGNDGVRVILNERHFKATIDVSGLQKTRAFAEDPETGKCLELILREKIELALMEFNIIAALTATNNREMIYDLRSRLEQSYEDRQKILREFGAKLMGRADVIHQQPQQERIQDS